MAEGLDLHAGGTIIVSFVIPAFEAPMSNLVRLSFSLEEPLYEQLDQLVRQGHYANRSEFIRDLIRSKVVEREWERNREAVGTITLVYNHHARLLSQKLTGLQHRHHSQVLATTHVHLDRNICVEAIMVKGRAREIREIAGQLQQQKGVLHASVAMSSTGKDLV
jgi:CopG family nickel-responsive transcriptional regulator